LDEVPDASLVMVGDGPLRESCISLAKTWGLGPRVSFPGALGHEQLLPLFAQACCFVQHSVTPSYGDAEGTPVAILEAGAAGLPVVSTRHAGIQDVVVHEKTGFLVQERDVQGMADYMRLLIKNECLCRQTGEDARKHVRSNFSITRHIGRLDELIRMARSDSTRTSATPNTPSQAHDRRPRYPHSPRAVTVTKSNSDE
jgi:glycosyltransferase involved in cell wall biosynthesis